MATLAAATTLANTGVATTGAAAAVGGDAFANTGREFLVITNGSGVSITATFDVVATLDGNAVTDKAVAVAAGVTKIIGPFPPSLYNDANGRVVVTYSAVTTVTVLVVRAGALG